MTFFDSILNYDQQLLIFLHQLGSESWDNFWIICTNPLTWIPLFFVLFYIGFISFGLKITSYISIIIALSGITALTSVNLIKNYLQRLRPIYDESINEHLRILIEPSGFSFVSGHSTVSFTIAFLAFWVMRKHQKFSFLFFLFPTLFAYSRIYLAVHYPSDIIAGMCLGYIISLFFYKTFLVKKITV
ncbi:phosphatase PAP2 family protein [Lutibacter sp.]|uniref:phosphatase PAP2 family protein n=1 Tax=Lutibacter sp. TaxID=1925666 RepID=UPI002736EC22|nr:phosphatase PAP2 family protein [Lutibacter sp.]MDP3312770.1 phosphatase PAP2 family protein [Lutibacter sp.]